MIPTCTPAPKLIGARSPTLPSGVTLTTMSQQWLGIEDTAICSPHLEMRTQMPEYMLCMASNLLSTLDLDTCSKFEAQWAIRASHTKEPIPVRCAVPQLPIQTAGSYMSCMPHALLLRMQTNGVRKCVMGTLRKFVHTICKCSNATVSFFCLILLKQPVNPASTNPVEIPHELDPQRAESRLDESCDKCDCLHNAAVSHTPCVLCWAVWLLLVCV